MRITTRAGRSTYVSAGCLGWFVLVVVILGVAGWLVHSL